MVDPVTTQTAPSGLVASSPPTLIVGLPPTTAAAYVTQWLAIIGLCLFAILRDGVPTNTIILCLVGVAGGNVAGGIVSDVVSKISNARVGVAQANSTSSTPATLTSSTSSTPATVTNVNVAPPAAAVAAPATPAAG